MEPVPGGQRTRSAITLWSIGLAMAAAFTALIWVLGPNLQRFTAVLLPDQGSSWYYWKLPARETFTMLIVWLFYLCHQFSLWAAIFFAQRDLAGFRSRTIWGLPLFSLWALGINLFFMLLHLLQTQVWFDGLAQDVPIFTSQGSVIIMLAIALILGNPFRGLFLGKKAGLPFTAGVVAFFRRSHMYIISWALVYTFWFHPMATDPQLLSGFFYMFLLFTQVSLAWTGMHLNWKWIALLESFVGIHALVVAVFNTRFFSSADMWPMFFSGFAFMFVFSYIYGFKVRPYVLWCAAGVYVLFLVWLYLPAPAGYGRSLSNLARLEFLWIPLILHALAWIFAGLAFIKYRK